MSSNMAVATKERPTSMRWTQMDFWDGMEHAFMMPSITAEERTAVWDAVAGYVQDQLLLHKGVRIPTLGSFDAVPKRIHVGGEVVTIRKPVFHLARNLAVVHNLMDNKAYLPGNKELEPLKYAKVAAAASVSRRKVEGCIQGTMSLLSHCLRKGQNVALILKDIGLLLIEGTKVQMKFYYDFLERLSGKQNLEKVIFKVPQLLDMVVSRVLPVASLTFSGRVIIFPKFEMAFVPKPPPRALLKTLRRVPGEEQQRRRAGLPPLGPGRRVGSPGFPFPATPSPTNNEIPQFWELVGPRKRKRSRVRQRPVSPMDSSAKKQPATGQRKGKLGPKGQASKRGRAQSYRGAGGGGAGGGGGGAGGARHRGAQTAATETQTAKIEKSSPERFCPVPEEPQKALLEPWSSEASLLEEPLDEHLCLGPTHG
ncbi:coiled-coil domain-containing protein 81-like [Ciconia boyciana]|uniref:coiled-coil domain-containing protein 81-like n=1 Tax=Ciconia boyciana TaxID=52775 RepID=UPI003BA16C7C